jgi:hypothetical protein
LRALIDGAPHARQDAVRRIDRGPFAAHAQMLAVEMERDRHETLERGQISVEVTAKRERVAQTGEFENPLGL